jgi:hypothetical protein
MDLFELTNVPYPVLLCRSAGQPRTELLPEHGRRLLSHCVGLRGRLCGGSPGRDDAGAAGGRLGPGAVVRERAAAGLCDICCRRARDGRLVCWASLLVPGGVTPVLTCTCSDNAVVAWAEELCNTYRSSDFSCFLHFLPKMVFEAFKLKGTDRYSECCITSFVAFPHDWQQV